MGRRLNLLILRVMGTKNNCEMIVFLESQVGFYECLIVNGKLVMFYSSSSIYVSAD